MLKEEQIRPRPWHGVTSLPSSLRPDSAHGICFSLGGGCFAESHLLSLLSQSDFHPAAPYYAGSHHSSPHLCRRGLLSAVQQGDGWAQPMKSCGLPGCSCNSQVHPQPRPAACGQDHRVSYMGLDYVPARPAGAHLSRIASCCQKPGDLRI